MARQSASPDIALPFPFPEMARAVLAWVAWKEDRYGEVEPLAEEVLGQSPVGNLALPLAGYACGRSSPSAWKGARQKP